jgi:hypothetical protein
MYNKSIRPVVKISLSIILVLVLFVASCKKTSDGNSENGANQANAQNNGVKNTSTVASNSDLVPLPLELPKPMFVGTPQNIQGVTPLEKALGRPRDPFLAPKGTTNVSLGKSVTSAPDSEPIIGQVSYITDGDKEASDGSNVELGPFLQNITIDLGAEYEIYAIIVWHYHKQARVYFDVIAQLSGDVDFIEKVTVFNNDIDNSAGMGIGTDMHYVETNEGKLIDAKGSRGRYVRLYSQGNNNNELNHYIEVEVWGKPVK